jgi:hypothetical protein
MRPLVKSRIFTEQDQVLFARFSGDFNPIHMDPVAARRTLSGQRVVHGMHGALWALDSYIAKYNVSPSNVNIRFLKPIFLNEDVSCLYDNDHQKLKITANSTVLTEISLSGHSTADCSHFELKSKPRFSIPLDPSLTELRSQKAQDFVFRGDIQLAQSLFSNFSKNFGIETCCEVAVISEIIGMQTPGLHSLLISANIKFIRTDLQNNYSIEEIDERFNLIKIAINATSLVCGVEAFIRPKPFVGASLLEMQNKVEGSEFSKTKALIIGGSRGLGECVAKLIALGDGESVITYSSGYDDCQRVSNEITNFGKKCAIKRFNIPQDLDLLAELGQFNQIYYFPTPKIFGKRNKNYSKNLYDNFLEIYVSSFIKVVDHFKKMPSKVSIFYPSSSAIDSPLPELAEYIDAKIEGEKAAFKYTDIENINIVCTRIPRTNTDQTMSLIQEKSENPEDIMLPIIRQMTRFN